ncbi:thioesterase family protein [Acinetobacter equi]|uniref:Acyl-CoA thioesterase n=1 Tax=Acinetobacter equi TaxID=1324350 RepID=A0A0N9VB84_9GAMM|nr:thioesterase family protein [Acinetobacter equi]ALH94524.1 acyl-CoA thioesterase [Acinetobacter equi]
MALMSLYKEIESQEWINIPEGWLQGRTIYGGLVAGILMYKALMTVNDSAKKLLSTSITFVGPVQMDKAKLTAEILREGKSVTTIEVRLWQDDVVQSILIASFGLPRQSEIIVQQEREAPILPKSDTLEIMKFPPFAPQCFQQMDLVWAEGTYPFTGSDQSDFSGWFRFNEKFHKNRKMNIADMMIAFDMWPPGILPMLDKMALASSLTWHVTYIQSLQTSLHDWMKYKVYTDYARDGYSTEYAHLWDCNDRLIAISRQTITIFA